MPLHGVRPTVRCVRHWSVISTSSLSDFRHKFFVFNTGSFRNEILSAIISMRWVNRLSLVRQAARELMEGGNNMKRLLAASCMILLLGTGAFAQTGTISGTVSDPSGAVIPGVEVTATHVGTSLSGRSLLTSEALTSYRWCRSVDTPCRLYCRDSRPLFGRALC